MWQLNVEEDLSWERLTLNGFLAGDCRVRARVFGDVSCSCAAFCVLKRSWLLHPALFSPFFKTDKICWWAYSGTLRTCSPRAISSPFSTDRSLQTFLPAGGDYWAHFTEPTFPLLTFFKLSKWTAFKKSNQPWHTSEGYIEQFTSEDFCMLIQEDFKYNESWGVCEVFADKKCSQVRLKWIQAENTWK